DMASYKVYGGTSASPTTLLATISSGTETSTVSSLTNGTAYYYRISANDNAGNESSKTSDVTSMPHVTDGDYSLSFDGVNDYVMTPDADELDGMNHLSIQMWLKFSSYSDYQSEQKGFTILSKTETPTSSSDNNLNRSYEIFTSHDEHRLTFSMRTGSGEAGISLSNYQSQMDLNSWYNLTVVYDGAEIKMYLNGTLVSEGVSHTGSILSTEYPVYFAKSLGNNETTYFNGNIDEVSIWNDALTAAEIAALFNSGNPLT
ncbi:uncharacterized protein METZ01_LOCUS445278, partial [marine metagenome]